MRDLRLAFRTLFKTPFVTVIAILSLALGIGANAAIFSLFDEMLLRPLPVQEPEQLINLVSPGPKPGSTTCNQAGDCEAVFSYPMYRDLEKANPGLSGLAAHRLFGANVAFDGQTLNGAAMQVSGSYFPVLGLRPQLGRLFDRSDDETPGGHPVAVLGHTFWETRLGSDPGVLDRTVVVNGQPFTIIGIAPRGFEGTTLGARPLLYVPLSMHAVVQPGWEGFENRRSYWAYVFGRMAPGTSLEQAQTALNTVYRPIINETEAPLQEGLSDQRMAEFRQKQIVVEEGWRGQSSVHEETRTPLLLLFATAGIVLLIACANIANLLLARGANRGMEMAVRLSLGASRRQVMSQLLTESVLLAVLGGAASLVVAHWTLRGIGALLPPDAAQSLGLELRWSVVFFAAALSIGTGILFGMFPALHSTRPDLVSTIRASAGNVTVTRGAARFRAGLVTAQIALSMTLLVLAGLFLRSLVNVSRVELGLDTENVIAFEVSPKLNGYEHGRSRVFFERLEEELAAVPGVTSISTARVKVIAGNNWGNDVSVEGFERTPDTDANSRFNMVGADFFSTLRIPLLSGRTFTRSDAVGTEEVAIVNEAFAKKFGLGRDPVGKRMSWGGDELDIQIVGLVKDAAYSEVKDAVPPVFYVPWRQDTTVGALAFYVRVAGDAAPVIRRIPRVVAGLDPNLPVEDLKTLTQQVSENVFMDRMISTLSAAFATLATLLAAVGLYGVLAYTVARRTREIGVRMAIGADARQLRGMVLGQVGRMLLIGGLVGIGAALALGKAASSLLFGIQGRDPLVMVGAAVVLGAFAFGAGYIPALRASRVQPMQALRYE
ncbi:MAG TPA: ABC transporter permease [Longimicrobiales bacterium]|nr:ABC transporter permease [Longimicrobiales bacterium]